MTWHIVIYECLLLFSLFVGGGSPLLGQEAPLISLLGIPPVLPSNVSH